MNPRHLVLAAALAGAAGLALFGERSASGDVVEPSARAAAQPRVSGRRTAPDEVAILRLQPRDTLISGADDSFDAGADDAFAQRSWTPPPPPAPPEPPPPAPTAPPLPFTFMGKSLEEGAWEVYLTRAERIYVVHDKDVVDGSYRVESIRPPLMTLTYLPLGQVQQLDIGAFE